MGGSVRIFHYGTLPTSHTQTIAPSWVFLTFTPFLHNIMTSCVTQTTFISLLGADVTTFSLLCANASKDQNYFYFYIFLAESNSLSSAKSHILDPTFQ